MKVEQDEMLGPVLTVAGADLMDGTPIYDIKPYIPYADCHPDAVGGFTTTRAMPEVEVMISDELLQKIPADKRDALLGVLKQDPRPRYQNDPQRIYGLSFAGMEIKFKVEDKLLTVLEIQ